jgi:hypothetical protein
VTKTKACECGCGKPAKGASRFASRTCKDRARHARVREQLKAKPKSETELTREGWLIKLMHELRPRFAEAGFPIPDKVHLSVGIPTKGGMSGKTGGECHRPTGKGKIAHIFVSPLLNGDRKAAGVLLHELAHAATPKAKHDGDFVVLTRALGCVDKPTHTLPGDEAWEGWLKPMVNALGPFPHSPLTVGYLKKKQKKGRMVRGACACDPPRPLMSAASTWLKGPVTCGVCETDFVVDLPEPEPNDSE